MSVFVDPIIPRVPSREWPHDHSCCLMAEELIELMEFVRHIGFDLKAIKTEPIPHMELTSTMRATAVAAGAIESRLQKAGEIYHQYQQVRAGE